MFLPFLSIALLVLTAIGGHAVQPGGDSNLTLFGAPRASLDGVLPVLSIEEDYILGQTDGVFNKAFGAAGASQCSAANPCADGSCCNSQGQCGFRDEHCKNSCVANCDATAPCGQNSEGGAKTCPLNVCCSYFGFCGATDSFCRDTAESGQSTPCQKSFGKCGTISPPTCGTGSGTASRRVAYYEAWNSRRRPCDKIYPSNIDTTGLTHLILSFATINPQTFAVGPMHPDDEKIYRDFLDLKDGSQKWVGIGGWEFSDAGVTRHTWSEMASTKSNRSAFIASLLNFLDKWNFQGVDIDWEWPGAESRGGNPAIDKRNQIDLMVELRQSLGSRGLSVVLPAQYEYLKNLDPKALEAQIDHFNVLSYDLHGPWDATVPGEGAYTKPHTDLKEIDTALNLFWFNGVSPNKINLGVANYGRGYTVADKGCAKYGCAWTGPSKAGECTQLEGVLSQCEIQRIIKAKNLSPSIIAGGAGVKQITFDGQWVGYDDAETLQLKTGLANNRCLGGTALWAIDYASCAGGSGGLPGTPQSSSAALSPYAPVVSVAPPSTASNALSSAPATSVALSGTSVPLSFVSKESTNPSSLASDAPPPVTATSSLSSAKSSSSDATFVASSSSKISSAQPPANSASASVSATSANVPVLPPAKSSNDVSSALSPGFSTPAQTGSFTARPTTIPVVPSFGSSRSVSWSPSSAGSLTGSVIASSVATTIEPPVKTSEVSTSAVTQTSSAAQVTSEDSSRSEALSRSEASSGSSTQATSGVDISASSTAGWLQPSRSPRPSESNQSSQSIQSPADTTTTSSQTESMSSSGSSAILTTTSGSEMISGTMSETPSSMTVTSGAISSTKDSTGSTSSTGSSPAQIPSTSAFAPGSSAQSSSWSSTSTLTSSLSSSASQTTTGQSTSAFETSAVWNPSTRDVTSSSPSGASSTSSGASSTFSGASSILDTSSWTSGPATTTSVPSGSSTFSSSAQSSVATSSASVSSQSASSSTSTGTGSSLQSSSSAPSSDSARTSDATTPGSSMVTSSSAQASSGAVTTSATMTSTSSSDKTQSSTGSLSSRQSTSEAPASSTAATSPSFSESDTGTSGVFTSTVSWNSNTGTSSVVTSPGLHESNTASTAISQSATSKIFGTRVPVLPTSTTSKVFGTPVLKGTFNKVCPKCIENKWCEGFAFKDVRDVPEFPPAQCLENEWCRTCWPKASGFSTEVCPTECWLSGWCRPLCGSTDNLPTDPPKNGMALEWFTAWWNKLPVKGCVPNDCKNDCATWYAFTILVLKRPVCLCSPKTCTKGEEKKNKDDKKCNFFGCGCGWLGLPFGPGCDIKIDFSKLFPFGIFGKHPCVWFGGCKFPPGTEPPQPPPGPPPPEDPNDDDFGGGGCGPLGCNGFCYIPGGCPPCPPEICGGPKCTKPGGCGPKTGPDPKPEPTRKSKCEEAEKTTVTERLVTCFEGLELKPTSIASINYTQTETITSLCLPPVEATYTGCGILGMTMTTTISSFTTTSSEAPACTRAPLNLDNDEGDNEKPTPTTDGPTCTRAPLHLDNDEGDNEQPTSSEAPSCTRAPLSLDDDEGDNEQPSSSEAPACTRAPLSLDDDEGNNEMPAEMSSSLSFTVSPTSTPSSNSSTSVLSTSSVLSSNMSMSASPTSSASSSSFVLSTSSTSISSSKIDIPTIIPPSEVSISSSTASSTTKPSSTSSKPASTHSGIPECRSGGEIKLDGQWSAYLEQEITDGHNVYFAWRLYDQNGCEAGNGRVESSVLGSELVTDIGAQHRPQHQMQGYMVNANVTDSTSTARSEILFTISKPPLDCKELCRVRWKVGSGNADKPWEITDDCASKCDKAMITTADVSCEDRLSKWSRNTRGTGLKRAGFCDWRMPFTPANDLPPPPPPPKPTHPPITRSSKWKVKIHQEMQYEDASVEWWLEDPNGFNAGHGKVSGHGEYWLPMATIEDQGRDGDPDSKMPYKVTMKVANCLNKDKTRIYFEFPTETKDTGCKTKCPWLYMVTETDDETDPFWFTDCKNQCGGVRLLTRDVVGCDPIPDAFMKKNAGYERTFECWWQGVWATRDLHLVGSGLSDEGFADGMGDVAALGIDGGANGSWVNSTVS